MRDLIIEAAAVLLTSNAYEKVTLDLVASLAGFPVSQAEAEFGSMRTVAVAILEAEGRSMRDAQHSAVSTETQDPIQVLRTTFNIIGRNMEMLPVVRAGMRIAAESANHFPERRIDPHRTWGAFIRKQLEAAQEKGLLRAGVDIDAVTMLLVSAGLGTKELVRFQDAWDEISNRMNTTLGTVLNLALKDSNTD